MVKDVRLSAILLPAGMYFPLIAHLLTRLILKEKISLFGHKSMMLGINRKCIKWLIFAVIVPFVYTEIGNWILVVVYPDILLSKNLRMTLGITTTSVLLNVLKKVIMALFFSIVAIGEESGFRGYNFGTDYDGFPYVGIVMMIFNCICAGCILTMLTIKTASIWPATIMHAFNNSRPGVISYYFNTYEISKINSIHRALITQLPICILGIICFLLCFKNIRNCSHIE